MPNKKKGKKSYTKIRETSNSYNIRRQKNQALKGNPNFTYSIAKKKDNKKIKYYDHEQPLKSTVRFSEMSLEAIFEMPHLATGGLGGLLAAVAFALAVFLHRAQNPVRSS